MALITADRVLETSTTTGTGAYTLAGAITGYRAASAVCANLDTFAYYAEDVDANGVPQGDWETGLGTWGTGGILTRTTIDGSSNAGAAVNWAAGTRRIALGLTARRKDTLNVQNKTGAYTVVAADNGTIINCTSGTFTVSLTAAATLGSGFNCCIMNSGSGVITIDPSGSEVIDNSNATVILRRSEISNLLCTGVKFQTIARNPFYISCNPIDNILPVASGANAISLGLGTTASGNYSVALGASNAGLNSATASANHSLAAGNNSAGQGSQAVTGAGAMALGGSYASGIDSFAAAIGNNTSTYGAQGTNSIAIGFHAKSTGAYSMTLGGSDAAATGTGSVAIGGGIQFTGAQASGSSAFALGDAAVSAYYGKYVYASSCFSSAGDAQTGAAVLRRQTTDATAVILTANNAAPSATNQVILTNNQAMTFEALITARQNTTGDTASWNVSGCIKRGASAAATSLVGTVVSLASAADAGAALWTAVLSADTTNGGLKITVTGEAAKTIRWSATVFTNELAG